jgi:hypothetical protein
VGYEPAAAVASAGSLLDNRVSASKVVTYMLSEGNIIVSTLISCNKKWYSRTCVCVCVSVYTFTFQVEKFRSRFTTISKVKPPRELDPRLLDGTKDCPYGASRTEHSRLNRPVMKTFIAQKRKNVGVRPNFKG